MEISNNTFIKHFIYLWEIVTSRNFGDDNLPEVNSMSYGAVKFNLNTIII